MSANGHTHETSPATYAELAGIFMPRPLHDRIDYQNALEVLDGMAGFTMNADQEDYFQAVATLVEKYEAEHSMADMRPMRPLALIRSLTREHGMSEADLGRLLGNRSLGHRILGGERQLSKANIRALAVHFRLNPAALLGM